MGKASSAKKVARAARAGGSTRKDRPKLAFPLAIFGVVLLGALIVVYARVDHSNTASADVKPSYKAGDHWHAAYGFYVCDSYLPPISDALSTDELGIHTHGDGLIHVHPFRASASGDNARMALWGKQVAVTFTDDGWTMPDGTEHTNGNATCNGQPAKTAVYKWSGSAAQPTEVYEGDYANIAFTDDGAIYSFAVLPQDWPADKLPPQPDSVSALANPLAAEGGGSTGGIDPSSLGIDPSSLGVDSSTPAG